MHERLLVQTPWAKFCINVYFKKIMKNVAEEGIRIIIENQKDWYSGLVDEQFATLLSLVFIFLILFYVHLFLSKVRKFNHSTSFRKVFSSYSKVL